MDHIGGEPGISAYYYCSANRTLLRGKRLRSLTYAFFPVRSSSETGGAIFILILIIIHYNQNKVNVLNIQNSSHFYIFCTYTAFSGELLCGCSQGDTASANKKDLIRITALDITAARTPFRRPHEHTYLLLLTK